MNGNNVFNGAPSTLWLNVKACLQSQLADMASEMVTAGLTYDGVRTRFDEHQGTWPEAVFCEDTNVKYVNPWILTGDKDNILRAQGSKKAQRDYWMYYRYYYWCSKYLIGAAKNEYIMLRVSKPDTSKETTTIVKPSTDLDITPFSHLYLNVGFGQNVMRKRAEKNEVVHFTSTLTGDYADTPVTIYAASQIKDIGDLSPVYPTSCDISRASNLQRLIVGNPTPGYKNESLTSISLGNNTKLKTIDVRNCVNLTGTIAAGQCENIEEIYAENSSISSVTLPIGGDLRIIHFPETTSAIAIRKHLNLTDFRISGTDKLTSLYIEECPGIEDDILSLVQNAPNLTNVHLANINWSLDSTGLLDKLLTLGGKSEDGSENTDQSYLSGTVHVPLLNTSRQKQYEAAWGDLTVTYDTFLEEYPVTFQNDDGTVLEVQWVVRGKTIDEDPVNRKVNPIKTPTKASTVDTDFHYAGWDSEAYKSAIYGALTITATYTTTVREYKVRWYVEGVLKQEASVPYGSGAEYTGEEPVKADNAAYDIYYLFAGWDKNSYRIYADTDVNALFVTGATPAAPSDPNNKPALSTRSVAEINAICKSGQKDWETVYKTGAASSFEQKYFDIGDEIDITIGWEPDDEESNDHLIFDLEKSKSVLHYNTENNDAGTETHGVTLPITFNQESGDPTYLDTGVKLMHNNGVAFGEDDDYEFTFVIDFAGNDISIADGTKPGEPRVLDCMGSNDGYEHGFKLYQTSSGAMTLQYAASTMTAASARSISTGSYLVTDPVAKTYTETTDVMYASFLERLIVRKKKGERGVTIYRCNPTSTTYTTNTLSYSGNTRVPHEKTIWLGCGRSAYGYINAGTLANCTVYNFKVWDVAMSDIEMAKMAMAPKEKHTFQLYSFPRTTYGASGSYNYMISAGTVTGDNPDPASIYPGIGLGMKNQMRNYRTMNSTNINTTGWESCMLRSWLGDRVYNALPQVWKSAMKTVNVRASAGGGASTPPDSAYELITSRDKLFLWSTREYGGYSGSPYSSEGTQISLFTDNASRRKYQEYGHKKIYYWYWTRSPYLLSSAYFCHVNIYGYCSYLNAYGGIGVSAGFCV